MNFVSKWTGTLAAIGLCAAFGAQPAAAVDLTFYYPSLSADRSQR